MTDAVNDDLRARTRALLEPGDIDLVATIVHTDFGRSEDIEMHEATVEVGDVIARHADVAEWYVYSGNDDSRFASNQHQGLSIPDDEFVWECQQLLREGTFDIVFYYESSADHDAILRDVRALGYGVTGVTT